MKRILFALLASCFFASCGDSSESGGSVIPSQIGYEGVAAFDSLSSSDYSRVRGLKVFFQHASVGQNTVDGLAAVNNSDSKYGLLLYSGTESRIVAEFESGNACFADCYQANDGWQTKMNNFRTRIDGGVAEAADVSMMKLCYIDDDADYTTQFNTYRDMMINLEAKYPEVTFIWWTMPIKTTGSAERDGFNSLVRAYASANGKWLFDIASIESHDPSGAALSDSTGEIMCTDYNSGDGGHPNTSAGELRIGKAMWSLLAKIAEARRK